MYQLLPILLGALTIGLALLAWRWRLDAKALRSRYAPLIDVDAELAAAKAELAAAKGSLDQTRRDQQALLSAQEGERAQLSLEYAQARSTYDTLKKEVTLLEENLEDISFGLYKPHFNFDTSDEYKAALEKLWDQERQAIREGRAATCPVQWTVGSSQREGVRMVKLNTKLVLRAFNGECDAAVAKVSWNNVTRMEERIRKSASAINALGNVLKVSLTAEYVKLKLDELRLTHEYEEKRHQEREEQRRMREQIREEEKAKQELEKAQKEAEQEEERYQSVLEKARAEAALATGAQLEKLTEKVQSFEAKLEEARRVKEKAISRAQLTKSGFVYMISNIGSFGERVCKIGLTRRLEPMDRIRELGDSSVPFPFDLHAMLYSDDAPALEYALHQHLEAKRLNLVNIRREFYFDVDLDEIEQFVRERGFSAQFTKLAEAKEYRQSLALRLENGGGGPTPETHQLLPVNLFGDKASPTPPGPVTAGSTHKVEGGVPPRGDTRTDAESNLISQAGERGRSAAAVR